MEVIGQLRAPAALFRRKASTQSIGDWVGPEDGMDDLEKETNILPLPGIEPQPSSP
jgi:hypothetical protein